MYWSRVCTIACMGLSNRTVCVCVCVCVLCVCVLCVRRPEKPQARLESALASLQESHRALLAQAGHELKHIETRGEAVPLQLRPRNVERDDHS
jgi:hypothetical protein